MESHQNSSSAQETQEPFSVNVSDKQRLEEALSSEMLQRYLKGLGNCKKHRHRSCLSQELYKLLSS